MVGSLDHRGPDDSGTWDDEEAGLFLGFRRLSIIDLSSAGHQPMLSASQRFVVTFNGEVYNFGPLRQQLLGLGCRFRGGSDTEVLLAAVEQWGVEATVHRLRGMFAFALFDRGERVLWLARDRMGVKPLYMLLDRGGLAFASEARAFHPCPLFSGRGDRDVALRFLHRLYVPGSHSILAGVEKVRPGELVKLRLGSGGVEELERIRYWNLPDVVAAARRERLTDPSEAVDGLHELLRESVRLRMIADVPVGAFLSGGIDSSTVVAIMQEVADRRVKTFTISFDDPDFDEGPAANAIADHLGTDHTSVALPTSEVLALVPALAGLSDEPMANPSLLPTTLVSQVARRSVVVGLTGDGGDELFGGYNRYRLGARLIRNTRRVPPPLRPSAAALLASVASTRALTSLLERGGRGGMGSQQSLAERLMKVARVVGSGGEQAAYEELLNVGMPSTLLSTVPSNGSGSPADNPWQGPCIEDRMMLMDQVEYLPDDLLTKVDRASMWASLEARVPILDQQVVEFSWRLPAELKIKDGQTKWPLRRIAERYIPNTLLDGPKMGFTVPVAKWLRTDLREWALDTLRPAEGSGLWDPAKLDVAWKRFDDGHDELGLPLWTAVVLEGWSQAWNVRFAQ